MSSPTSLMNRPRRAPPTTPPFENTRSGDTITLGISETATLTQHGWPTKVPLSLTFSMPSAETNSLAMLSMLFRFYTPKRSDKGATWTHTFFFKYV